VAASTRRSTCTGAAAPSAATCPSCSTRNSLAWLPSGRSPISSSSSVPWSAPADEAGPVLARVGEGAAPVAEQLALDQGLGQRGAVDGHELPRPPRQRVDLVGHHLLARCRSRPPAGWARARGPDPRRSGRSGPARDEGGEVGGGHAAEGLGGGWWPRPGGPGRRCARPRTSRRRAGWRAWWAARAGAYRCASPDPPAPPRRLRRGSGARARPTWCRRGRRCGRRPARWRSPPAARRGRSPPPSRR
jgi:hypothetical protein